MQKNDTFSLFYGFILPISQYSKKVLLRSNEYTCQFGLSLSEQDIEELMLVRRECLQEHQRIEFGKGVKGYHSFEHALFSYMTAADIKNEDIDLYYALPEWEKASQKAVAK